MDRFDRDESPMRDNSDEGAYDHNQDREHRSKDRNQSRSRGDDREHRNTDRKDLEKDRKERRKEDRDDRDKDRSKEKHRDRDKDRKEKEPERDREIEKERGKDKTRDRETEKERGKDKTRDRETEKERGKDKIRDRERERERDKTKDKEREKGKEKHKDREKERESEKDRDREKAREKSRDQGREMDIDKERSREREKVSKKAHEDNHVDTEDNNDRGINKQGKVSYNDKDDQDNGDALTTTHVSSSNLSDRIMKMKEERLKQKSEGVPEVLAWINRSRKLEEKKIIEKKKALQFSKMFKEQDNIVQGESEDEEEGKHINHNLAGVKVLHGLDKVMEGGAVVLTLKDQHILSGGDLNEDVDMLENTEIGEQKRRDEAYKAAKKKTGIYADKFSDDPSSERTILPQYDDPVAEEGLALDARGRFNVEAEKKLEELRRRIQGGAANYRTEDLTLSAKTTSDYYTQEEMMIRFNKPKKKKKSLRKKDKLDLDALEAEAVSTGLGAGDLGSRKDGRRQAMKDEQERHDAEMKSEAYKEAYAKADEAIKSLRMEGTLPVKLDTEEPFADDEDDFYKSLERTRKLALKKQQEAPSGPEAIARLAASQTANEQNPPHEESEEKKVVITEMQEFVWGLPLGEEVQKQDHKDVFLDEDEGPVTSDHEMKDEPSGWTEVKDNDAEENSAKEDKEDIVPDETIHEPAVGKGLSGALHLLKGRGTLKEGIEWGGRNMDKKKSKLVGIVDDNAVNPVNNDNRFKDIRIERTDEFGRIMTPKEAFRMISHKFHGKGPGKMKQEKRMKQYQEELKLKQMKNSDTPTESVERMREAQARLKTPYLVLSGHVKPGQTSDPKSGFATVEKDLSGGLTPMLGNRKVEQFLGIKRKGETDNTDSPKKPKT